MRKLSSLRFFSASGETFPGDWTLHTCWHLFRRPMRVFLEHLKKFRLNSRKSKVQHHFNCLCPEQNPSVAHSPPQRRLGDLNPWPWPVGCCRPEFRLQAQTACCSVIWVNTGRRRDGNTVTRSAATTVLLPHILWALIHICKGLWKNWDILLFLLQSSLYPSPSLTLRPIHPSHPILIISHFHSSPSPALSVSPSHPSVPILIALPTGGNSRAGCSVSTSFIGRSVYEERRER